MDKPNSTAQEFRFIPSDDGEPDEVDEYAWCWIACPHDPPCACAPRSSDPRELA